MDMPCISDRKYFVNKTTNGFQSFYAVRLYEYPKTSCLKIANIERAGRCLETYRTGMHRILMISHFTNTGWKYN